MKKQVGVESGYLFSICDILSKFRYFKKARLCFLPSTIIIFMLFPLLLNAQQKKELPSFYGHYVLSGNQWVEIPEMVTTTKAPLKGSCSDWGILTLNSEPNIKISDSLPTFFIYKQGIEIKKIKLLRLWYFKELPAYCFHGAPPDPAYFMGLCGTRRDAKIYYGGWTVVGSYSMRSGGVSGNQEMIRMQPKIKLQPGTYAICHSDNISSRPVPMNLNIPIYPFDISGEFQSPEYESPLINTPFRIQKCNLSDDMGILKNPNMAKTDFSISTTQLIAYLEVRDQKGGEKLEFIFEMPDGSIYDSLETTLGPQSKSTFFTWVRVKPNNLLMPGRWTFKLKLNNDLLKLIYFTVTAE